MSGNFSERPAYFELAPPAWNPLAQGIVFFGGGRHPGSTYYHDSSLYGNHGTLTDMVPSTDWIPRIGRFALAGDGNAHYVSHTAPALGTQFSFAFWVQIDTDRTINTFWRSATIYRQMLYRVGNGLGVYSDSGDGYYKAVTLSLGVPNHIAFVNNALTVTIYVNGASIGTVAPASFTFAGASKILGEGATYGILGWMADCLCYNRLLSAREVNALADPSNVMLRVGGSDLLRYRPSRSPVYCSGGAAAAFNPSWYVQRRRAHQGAA
jgi:hypothetical protein